MPILKNPKREQFCVLVAQGMSMTDAYVAVGYTANPANIHRFVNKWKLRERIDELRAEISAKITDRAANAVVSFEAINPREQMHKMIEIVDKAIEAGDLKTAREGQQFILTCFGYADMPTLTHEHMTEKPLEPKNGGQRQEQPQDGAVMRFERTIAELRKRTGRSAMNTEQADKLP